MGVDYAQILNCVSSLALARGLFLVTALSRVREEIYAVSLRLISTKSGKPVLVAETVTYAGTEINLQAFGRFMSEIAFALYTMEQFPGMVGDLVQAFRKGTVCKGFPEHWGMNLLGITDPDAQATWNCHVSAYASQILRTFEHRARGCEYAESEAVPEGESIH